MSIDNSYLLQQYENGKFGYYLIDGDEHCNYKIESEVICMQGEDEGRDEFISKNDITFKSNQYGSNLKLDKLVNDEEYWVRAAVARQGYDLEKLINDENIEVRKLVANSLNWKDDDFIIDLGNKLLDKGKIVLNLENLMGMNQMK